MSPIKKIFNPLRDLINDSRFTGVMLIGCTLLSLLLSNWIIGDSFIAGWNSDIPVGLLHRLNLPKTALEWINNLGMAFFFLLAATEIKRELLSGELSSFKRAILPFGAAFGGMLVPALIFTLFNLHSSYSNGWGIPTATDIAFSIAAASLIGKRFPVGLKVLLLALAIIDDLGAIVVIALFYGGNVNGYFLLASLGCFAVLLLCNKLKLKFGALQVLLGVGLWYCMLQSGIEASISGVLFAFALPVNALARVEKGIHRWVNFLILPLFAFANTALLVPSEILSAVESPVGMGVIFGLVLGKPIGIFLACRVMVATGAAQLPKNIQWKQVFGMGTLAGIGFTMSIFTTMLAFSEPAIRDIAKVAILISVVLSVVLSGLYFRFIRLHVPSAAHSANERQLELS